LSLPPDLTGVGSQLLLTVVPRLANVSTEFINVAFSEATERVLGADGAGLLCACDERHALGEGAVVAVRWRYGDAAAPVTCGGAIDVPLLPP
jgi:hypothetical protein